MSDHLRRICCVAALLCQVAGGCGSEPAFEFDELDLAGAENKLDEVPLGEYSIPIPTADGKAGSQDSKVNRFQIDFELFALVSPHQTSKLSEVWRRHQGVIRDRVIRVCRDASLDVLHEPELATLKAKLIDALGPQLGDDVHQLLITDVVTREI